VFPGEDVSQEARLICGKAELWGDTQYVSSCPCGMHVSSKPELLMHPVNEWHLNYEYDMAIV
jgi:hypothetical protein